MRPQAVLACLALLSFPFAPADAREPPPDASSAERGYWLLVNKAYVTPDFDQETFDAVWKVWPEPLKSQAEKASADERRMLAFSRYGLTPRPDDPAKPLQYVVEQGVWTMNC